MTILSPLRQFELLKGKANWSGILPPGQTVLIETKSNCRISAIHKGETQVFVPLFIINNGRIPHYALLSEVEANWDRKALTSLQHGGQPRIGELSVVAFFDDDLRVALMAVEDPPDDLKLTARARKLRDKILEADILD
jgi:hypothetical protein